MKRQHGNIVKVKYRFLPENNAGDKIRCNRGGHGSGQHYRRKVFMQFLQGKHHPGQGGVKGRRQPCSGPAGE